MIDNRDPNRKIKIISSNDDEFDNNFEINEQEKNKPIEVEEKETQTPKVKNNK